MNYLWGIVMTEGIRFLKQSPKGNQDKWVANGYVFKRDNLISESLSEYLVSIFLESSNSPIPFIPYRLSGGGVCSCPSYKPRYDFIPFAKLLDAYFYVQPRRVRIVNKRVSVFNYWHKTFWSRYSVSDRINFIVNLFGEYGISRDETIRYLTCMVELDTLMLNIDRHFNNFGLMYDNQNKKYITSILFDNGLSLCAGYGVLGSIQDMSDLRKIKMQPLSSRISANRNSLPTFRFSFDVVRFCDLLLETSIYGVSFLSSDVQFGVLKRRLVEVYKNRDANGVDIIAHFKSVGL